MNPLLMDAVVNARQDELRRSARHPRLARRPSLVRALHHDRADAGCDDAPAKAATKVV